MDRPVLLLGRTIPLFIFLLTVMVLIIPFKPEEKPVPSPKSHTQYTQHSIISDKIIMIRFNTERDDLIDLYSKAVEEIDYKYVIKDIVPINHKGTTMQLIFFVQSKDL